MMFIESLMSNERFLIYFRLISVLKLREIVPKNNFTDNLN